ncbi:MAG: sigma-70 family RNA polymerase sigma factor, partial [Clostridia bacterium]|nr:sigma-70 family RNA polymerase sigma factor [Clostridia bacterium]
IAKNCFYAYVKKSGRVDALDDETAAAIADPQPGVEATAIAADDAARARRALHALPEPYKEVFLWRVFAELPFEQIGALFGKTANWACVTFYRARKMLAERMEESK